MFPDRLLETPVRGEEEGYIRIFATEADLTFCFGGTKKPQERRLRSSAKS